MPLVIRISRSRHLGRRQKTCVPTRCVPGKVSALLNPITYVIVNLGVVAVIWFGSTQVDMGILAKGQVVALVNYMSQILVELIKLANLIVVLMRAYASVTRVEQIMEMPYDERT